MNVSKFVLVSAMGFGFLQAGCFAESADVESIDDVGAETLSGEDKTGGSNGLSADDYAENEALLWSATFAPFDNNNAALVTMSETKSGMLALEYAAKCALLPGVANAVAIEGTSYFGNGVLNTTNNWPNSALSAAARHDLFACMAAHINPAGESVPMAFSGASVTDGALTPIQSAEYSFPEALWVAYETVAGELKVYVFPLPALENACGTMTSDYTLHRACGLGRPSCRSEVRSDFATACTVDTSNGPNAGDWTCDGHPAVQTWLKPDQRSSLYPNCN